MLEEGYVKMFRQLKRWQHYQKPSVVLVWIDILLSVNTQDAWWHGRKIRRGELFTSIDTIHQSTGLDPKTIRKALATLEESGEIKMESTNAGTKIAVNHFDKFQSWGIIPQPVTQPTPQPIPQPVPQRVPYKQEYKEVEERKEEKNINTHTHHAREGEKIGIFQNVRLTDSDLETIRINFATEGLDDTFLNRCVDKLSSYMAQNGTHYTNHAAAILSWVKAAVLEEDRRTGKAQPKPATETEEQKCRRIWAMMKKEDQEQHLKENDGLYPWEDPRYNKSLKQQEYGNAK